MPQRLEEKLAPPPKFPPEIKKEEKEKPEEVKFFLRKIKLVGCESILAKEFRPIVEKYENREVSLEELNILAKEIEREYLRKGIVAACFIPPQEIKEGIIILQVIEAKMGDLEIQDHKYFRKERITYYWKLLPGEVLSYDKISQSLQLMNKNPDREVKAVLYAGKKPKTTDVLLNVDTNFPLHLIYSFDNEGITYTGKYRYGWGLKHNNLLGLDDTLLSGYTFGKHFSGIYSYHTLPLTNFGTSLLYGVSLSKSFPKNEYEPYAIDSRAKNWSFFLYQDIFKKDQYLGNVYFGLDVKDKTIKMNTGTHTRDRLRILRLGGDFLKRGFGSTTRIRPEISQGINLFGARRSHLSSRGSENTFSKINLGIQHKRALPLDLQASLKLNGQLAFKKLAPQEEFPLGGIDSVRGYPSQDFLADNALQTNLELLIPAFFIPKRIKIPYAPRPLKDDITALVFFDYGWGERKKAESALISRPELKSVGAGLRIKLFDQALLRLEWGFPLGESTITEKGKSRFHFSLNFEDKFPQELERIKKLIKEGNIKERAWSILNNELRKPDSILREKLYKYLYLAQLAYREGNFKRAKEYYQKIYNIGNSLYQQAESFIKECIEQEKQLREYNKLARQYYKEGDFKKAKEIWQKIIKEAKIKSLVLEY